MKSVTFCLYAVLLAFMICFIGCAPANTPTPTHTVLKTKNAGVGVVTIPQAQDLFTPFILVIQPHTTVMWRNSDTSTHSFMTTPQGNTLVNPQAFSLTVAAHNNVTFTFTQPGLYHYYDTHKSTWQASLARILAKPGTAHFPLVMDGIIWVQGPISDLPSVAVDSILKGHDDFATEFIAITQAGSVTWHNFDEDPHFLGLVSGWSTPINPTDIGLHRISGTDDAVGGASVTVLFNTPGLYYYYCRNHDQINQATDRAQALTMASEYPIPMEGFVLVI